MLLTWYFSEAYNSILPFSRTDYVDPAPKKDGRLYVSNSFMCSRHGLGGVSNGHVWLTQGRPLLRQPKALVKTLGNQYDIPSITVGTLGHAP